MTPPPRRILCAFAIVVAGATAHAQKPALEVDVQRGPATDLYIRKRPIAPEAPVLTPELRKLLTSTEKRRDDKRLEAISLLRAFLAAKPTGEARADALFKLAELLWEEARRTYLLRMEAYTRVIEKCSNTKRACEIPPEPRIDLTEAEGYYRELHDKFADFSRMDLVTYLLGFASKEAGRQDEAMTRFQEVIDRFPTSPLFGDAWMMVGEHWFANSKWQEALAAYRHIPDDAATSDLATFKIAWCEWKLGDTMAAAADFKRVLDKRHKCESNKSAARCKRTGTLAEEALDYLVVVFTEDRGLSAKEVFDFLVSIGGQQYSHDVMVKVAASYGAQGESERSNEAYRFLIRMAPESIKAADYQRAIVNNWNSSLDIERAQDEIRVLLGNFGPTSAWAKQQKNRDALARSLELTEELVRVTATNLHGEAQRREKALKLPKQTGCTTSTASPPDVLNFYNRAAAAYESYLGAFGTSKIGAQHAVEIRYYRADILCFKLARPEDAGDEYLAVGKTTPVGKLHKDALINAMGAFETARPKDAANRGKIAPVDKKFGEAIDQYATLFPADPTLVGVIFKNGQMFFDYGEYDEAIKRFGVIVTKYPKDPNAGPAGDRILAALNKAADYENIESWARKLKTAPSFSNPAQQARLNKLIIDSILHSGQKFADAGKYEKAATFYLRIPKEPAVNARVAADAMMNAGVMYEKAKRPERAADIYLNLAEKYGSKAPEQAEKAAFAAGVVYEQAIFFDRAAKSYEVVINQFGKGPHAADALYNAGLLRQALGQNDKAIAHYREYARRFSTRKDAADVAFNIGVVYEDAGQEGPALRAFESYARTYASTNKRIIEAHVRAGRLLYKLGQLKKAKAKFAVAQAKYKRAAGAARAEAKSWLAEARYYEGEMIFKDYEKVSIDVKPSQLGAALTKKTKLLAEAEKVYFSIADYNDLKWATAALYRDGQIYEVFAEALAAAASQCPSGLSEEDCQRYQDAISEKVVQIQDKAVSSFTVGYNKAIQMQVYNEYTAKTREALGKLAAQKFPPEHESRQRERNGDRPLVIEYLTELAR